MTSDWLDKPVIVRIGDQAAYSVERIDVAADVMRNDWPTAKGPAFGRAQEALLKARDAPRSGSARLAARKAFEAAAREAGILIED